MFHFAVPVQRTETDILHFLCSVFHARLIRNYVNHTMWKETRIEAYILYFFINKIKDFYIYTTERTKEVPNKRSKTGEKKIRIFYYGNLINVLTQSSLGLREQHQRQHPGKESGGAGQDCIRSWIKPEIE